MSVIPKKVIDDLDSEMDEEFDDDAYNRDDLLTKCTKMVLQFLSENGYPDTLKALEEESGVTYTRSILKTGSVLMNIVQQHEDLREAEAYLSKDTKDKGSLKIDAAKDPELCAQPSGRLISETPVCTYSKAHKANVLAVCIDPVKGAEHPLVISSSTDRTVAASSLWVGKKEEEEEEEKEGGSVEGNVAEGEPLWRTNVESPGISMDWSAEADCVVVGTMIGAVFVINARTGEIVQRMDDHQKYVIDAKWVDGSRFVTASHDHRLFYYARDAPDAPFARVHEWLFSDCVESVVVRDAQHVIVSVRNDCFLHEINLENGEANPTYLNMNALGDDYVSFNALHLELSPSKKYVLVSNDKNRIIAYDLSRDGVLVRNFYGAVNDELSQPRTAWDPSGQYIYSTSQDGNIYAWEVCSEKIVAKFAPHKKIIRTLAFSPIYNLLVTGSYDKTLKVFTYKDN